MTEQKPLSAEEEATLRKRLDAPFPFLYQSQPDRAAMVARLLATLDAARAEVTRLAEVHNLTLRAMDDAARAATPAAPEALREAARDILRNGSIYHDVGTIRRRLEDALAASPAPARPSGDLAALKARGWLKHTDGCSWEFRKEDGTKECNCGLLAALSSPTPDSE